MLDCPGTPISPRKRISVVEDVVGRVFPGHREPPATVNDDGRFQEPAITCT